MSYCLRPVVKGRGAHADCHEINSIMLNALAASAIALNPLNRTGAAPARMVSGGRGKIQVSGLGCRTHLRDNVSPADEPDQILIQIEHRNPAVPVL